MSRTLSNEETERKGTRCCQTSGFRRHSAQSVASNSLCLQSETGFVGLAEVRCSPPSVLSLTKAEQNGWAPHFCFSSNEKIPAILEDCGYFVLLRSGRLDCLYVLGLPALGALGHVELHGLAFLQAAEAARLNRGEMHEDVFAILTADKAIAFGVVKPLHCSLFCHC